MNNFIFQNATKVYFGRGCVKEYLACLTKGASTILLAYGGGSIRRNGIYDEVTGILRGAGDVKMFTIANLVNLAIRVLLSWLCAPLWGVEIVWYAVPVGWLANFVISFAHYRTGKWKEKRIA